MAFIWFVLFAPLRVPHRISFTLCRSLLLSAIILHSLSQGAVPRKMPQIVFGVKRMIRRIRQVIARMDFVCGQNRKWKGIRSKFTLNIRAHRLFLLPFKCVFFFGDTLTSGRRNAETWYFAEKYSFLYCVGRCSFASTSINGDWNWARPEIGSVASLRYFTCNRVVSCFLIRFCWDVFLNAFQETILSSNGCESKLNLKFGDDLLTKFVNESQISKWRNRSAFHWFNSLFEKFCESWNWIFFVIKKTQLNERFQMRT